MKNFAIIGAAGYIAPRHMKAIKETGNNLITALDKNDSVGVIDSYFPNSTFFTEFERFDRHIDLLKREGQKVDYISICSPNYLHDSHIRFALRVGADAICEKPLIVNPWNLKALIPLEEETGKKVHNILQLRLHPSIVALKDRIEAEIKENPKKVFDVDLTYLTSRGRWYFASWKGEEKKSGGITANIGIHFFDMLLWVFGGFENCNVHVLQPDVASGTIKLKNAKVRWFLSVNADYIPKDVSEKGQRTFRSIKVDGEEIEFSDGFTDLHTKSYEKILAGQSFGLTDALPSIEMVQSIRRSEILGLKGEYHPYVKKVLSK